MSDRLGHKQTAAMFTLMVLAREVSNPELREIVGFGIDGKDRVDLNNRSLVTSRKEGRPFVHELTAKGRAWCGEELAKRTAPPPAPRSTLVPALYMLLGGFSDYLRRENVELSDVFTAGTDMTETQIEDRIRAAYRKLARSPRDWVGLVDLRPMLNGASRSDVDAVLKQLSKAGQAHLAPESNRKTLTTADHDAAIRLGGEDNHLISIEVS
jgi:hypothetical protein